MIRTMRCDLYKNGTYYNIIIQVYHVYILTQYAKPTRKSYSFKNRIFKKKIQILNQCENNRMINFI